MLRTRIFLQLVTGTWNILNTRSPDAAKRTKDPDREKYINPNDYRLDSLLEMATPQWSTRLTTVSEINIFEQ